MEPITVAQLKAAGMTCWRYEYAGAIKLDGYSFDEFHEAVQKYCYIGNDSGALTFRLRPEHDPDARCCPHCNDQEIVMQPVRDSDDMMKCPNCKQVYSKANTLTRDQAAPTPPRTKPMFLRSGGIICVCGYAGKDGWRQSQIDQDERGNDYYGIFCPECDEFICDEEDF